MTPRDLRVEVLLNMQVALLGMVTPNIYAVLVQWNETEISIRVVFQGEISSDDLEAVSVIETEMIAQFPGFSVSSVCEQRVPGEPLKRRENEVAVLRMADSGVE